uniref:Uncharacterized protein n=1 Tax=viral metagenome TaxID=1070528 RepID=A0A6C0K3H2_9ZZZZ
MAAPVEFTDAEFIELVRKINKIKKNMRDAEFEKFKALQPGYSNEDIYRIIDKVAKGEAAYDGSILYQNSPRYKGLVADYWRLGMTDIYGALERLRETPKWDHIHAAARVSEGGGRTKRSRRSRKQRKTKRRARR